MARSHIPTSVASASTQPLSDDDWDGRSITSFYPSSEKPFTISSSQAGSIAPYTISRPGMNSSYTIAPFTVTPGVVQFAAANPQPPLMVIPYGVPMQPPPFQPPGQALTYPPLQNMHPFSAPVPLTVPQHPQWAQPSMQPSGTYLPPDWGGMATAYFPTPQQFHPLMQSAPLQFDATVPYWLQSQAQAQWPAVNYFSDGDNYQWPPTAPLKSAAKGPPTRKVEASKAKQAALRSKSAPPTQKSDSGFLGSDKGDLALTAALVIGTVALGALMFI
eukprot:GGOE01005246.1.p1 GENE.GGOE01005246.1~~GGOE01005246.1.p1  ORF type:complete len:274 (-),score=30.21 GGOE01005246.1:387-1208(-)